MITEHYPQPGAAGGRLIRQVISFLREQGVSLPLQGPVVIALSGGADSRALALLLLRYGRKILSEAPVLAHVDHGWRAESSRERADLVNWARARGVEVEATVLEGGVEPGRSLEDFARERRYAWLEQVRQRRGASWILTAHHQGDLAESVLWALATGQAMRRGGGIRVQDGALLRPLLNSSKTDLEAFLKEEAESWFEDSTNQDLRFLRARLRGVVFPALESVFPRVQEHLAALGLEAQKVESQEPPGDLLPLSVLFRDRGLRLRASQWGELLQAGSGGTQLPEGWRIRRDTSCQVAGENPLKEERWILERGANDAVSDF